MLKFSTDPIGLKDVLRMIKALSTSSLAKSKGISGKELFSRLESLGFIQRKNNEWLLLPAGENAGSQYVDHHRYGKNMFWPESLSLDDQTNAAPSPSSDKLVTATVIGRAFNLSGKSVGGEQKKDFRSAIPYVVWPEAITENKALKITISEVQDETPSEEAKPETNDSPNFRDKIKAK